MILNINEIVLGLFVINLGIACGAGLYETLITLPIWFSGNAAKGWHINTEIMIKMDVGRRFWGFVTTMPLTLLTIASLVLVFRLQGQVHDWWLAATLIVFTERLVTFFYFIPTAIKMAKSHTFDEEKASKMAAQWKNMNRVRLTLNLAGWLAALGAFYATAAQPHAAI